jgi:hypothetical protein
MAETICNAFMSKNVVPIQKIVLTINLTQIGGKM